MFGEREVLHKRILPRINELAKEYGEYVECTDLRWGLDTEHMGKILEVCFSQIKDPCHYNMIVFLGKYYGTIPENVNMVKDLWMEYVGMEGGLHDYQISNTQLELEYGLFRDTTDKKDAVRICLIRDMKEGEIVDFVQCKECEDKQKRLISRIKEVEDDNTYKIEYKAKWCDETKIAVQLEEMENSIVKIIEQILKNRSIEKKKRNWVEAAELEAETFRTQLIRPFRGREELKQKIKTSIECDSVHTIWVYGASASGKSSILSKLYEECNIRKYFIACGHAVRSRNYLDILLQMIYFIEKNLEKSCGEQVKVRNFYSEEKAEAILLNLIDEYNVSEEEEMLIFVDALDKLTSAGEIRIPSLLKKTGKIKIICSQMIEKPEIEHEGIEAIEMPELTKDDIRKIVIGNMVVSENYVEEIVKILCERKQSKNPLCITSIISILKMHLEKVRGMNHDKMYRFFCNLTERLSDNPLDLCWKAIEETGSYLEFPMYKMVCGMIAASKNGLRAGDLEQIFMEFSDKEEKKEEWKFNLFRAYLDKNQFFRIWENGCWTFGHDLIKAGVTKNLTADMDKYKEILFKYLQKLPAHDEVKIEEGLLLCSERGKYAFAKHILEEFLDQKENKREATLIMQTLYSIAKDKKRIGWYHQLVRNNPRLILSTLEKGLRYDSGTEFERRYPAKELADIYWNVWSEEINRNWILDKFNSLENNEKFDFCTACAEYIGIYDDISRQEEVFVFELPVYEYICKQVDFKNMTDEQKECLFKIANIVFYINNKIISFVRKGELKNNQLEEEAEKISQDIIEWYRENIQKGNVDFKGKNKIEGKFINNIGQYFNAVKDYSEAFPYRLQALRLKATVLFDSVDDRRIWKEKFESILNENGISVQEHRKFWKNFRESNDMKSREKIWNQIAVSYRTIATDYYYIADTSENPEKILRKGLEFHNLCIVMQEQTFVENMEKELAVTQIRKLGTYEKLYLLHLKDVEVEDLIKIAQTATEKILRVADLDKKEGNNLKQSLGHLIELFKRSMCDCKELEECYRLLPNVKKEKDM